MSYNEAPSPIPFTLSAKVREQVAQPSECQECEGRGRLIENEDSDFVPAPLGWEPPTGACAAVCLPEPFDCPDCQGTGHNIRGYLPKPPKVL